MHTITKRLYITVDGDRLVEEGDPDAQFLYANPGRKISDEDAAKFGLLDVPEEESPEEDATPEAQPAKKRKGSFKPRRKESR